MAYLLVPLFFFGVAPSAVAAQSFRDVSKNDFYYEAVEALRTKGIVNGYGDGTYRPNAKVTRAEALKVIVTAKGVDASSLSALRTSDYDDVPDGAWFLPFVEWSRKELQIVDGPPKAASFHPERTVKKAEFLKMVILAYGMDPTAYSNITLPLALDVSDAKAWYYPYVRLSLATLLTGAGEKDLISPERELTRGDVALLLHRLLLYREGQRTQDLLSAAEDEILTVVDALNANDIRTAEHASARALVTARGAQTLASDANVVKAALKVAEGYRAMVRGKRAAVEKEYDDAIALYKDAYFIADQALELHDGVRPFAQGLRESSQKLATEARSLQ